MVTSMLKNSAQALPNRQGIKGPYCACPSWGYGFVIYRFCIEFFFVEAKMFFPSACV